MRKLLLRAGTHPVPDRSQLPIACANRSAYNKEKAVDTELVAQGTEIICTCGEVMDLVIVSGDRDFIPLVQVAHRRGWSVEMAAFTAPAARIICYAFDLDAQWNSLSLFFLISLGKVTELQKT